MKKSRSISYKCITEKIFLVLSTDAMNKGITIFVLQAKNCKLKQIFLLENELASSSHFHLKFVCRQKYPDKHQLKKEKKRHGGHKTSWGENII